MASRACGCKHIQRYSCKTFLCSNAKLPPVDKAASLGMICARWPGLQGTGGGLHWKLRPALAAPVAGVRAYSSTRAPASTSASLIVASWSSKPTRRLPGPFTPPADTASSAASLQAGGWEPGTMWLVTSNEALGGAEGVEAGGSATPDCSQPAMRQRALVRDRCGMWHHHYQHQSGQRKKEPSLHLCCRAPSGSCKSSSPKV